MSLIGCNVSLISDVFINMYKYLDQIICLSNIKIKTTYLGLDQILSFEVLINGS